jgi:hypothetical protein
METPTKGETTTVVTNPVILRHFINTVTLLVNRNIAHTAKYD